MKNAVVLISRIIVGSIFIISGLIKANDAIGFEYKLIEYFSEKALGLPDLIPYALPLAVFICLGEILLGVALLVGAFPKLTNVLLMVMVLFFGWLTYYTASCDPFEEMTFVDSNGQEYTATPECVLECGCFGNAIPLTPWESFAKDMVLLFFVIFTFLGAFVWKNLKLNTAKEDTILVTANLSFTAVFSLLMLDWLFPIMFAALTVGVAIIIKKYTSGKRKELYMGLGALVVCGAFQYYTLEHLPVKDYRPYAVGNDLIDGMKSAEEKGEKPPVYVTMYEMTNKDTKAVMELDSEKYLEDRIWEDKAWEITKSWGPIKKSDGYEPPIPPDFEFMDYDGNDMTPTILEGEDLVFLNVAYDLDYTNMEAQKEISALADGLMKKGHRFYGLSTAGQEQCESFRHEVQAAYPIFSGDEKILKTIVRANPGLVVLKGGVVQSKYHYNDLPSADEFAAYSGR